MKLKILMILMLTFAICAPMFAQAASGSPPSSAEIVRTDKNKQTVTVTVEDLQTFRKIAAERDSLQKECDELKRQCEKWQESAGSWQKLYEKEKFRADVVQENRITEIETALSKSEESNNKLKTANGFLHVQHGEDLERIGTLEFANRKLKADRWRYGLTGFSLGAGTGFAAGFYTGNKLADTQITIGNGVGGLAGNRLARFRF